MTARPDAGAASAELVIANPSGIQVNGAGFINASGVTLTTGTPVLKAARSIPTSCSAAAWASSVPVWTRAAPTT